MNNIVNTKTGLIPLNHKSDAEPTVNARDLHTFLGSKRDFSTWIKDRIQQYGFIEGKDFSPILVKSPEGRPSKEYDLTLDMAKELAMVERTEKGKQARQYFIECEKELKAGAAPAKIDYADPKVIIGVIQAQGDKIIQLEHKIEEDAPKVSFHDKFCNSDGLYGLQNAGRALECKPNKFIQWLKQHYLFYQGGNLIARQEFVKRGYFEIKVTMVDDKSRMQTLITPKGLEWLAGKLPDNLKLAS